MEPGFNVRSCVVGQHGLWRLDGTGVGGELWPCCDCCERGWVGATRTTLTQSRGFWRGGVR